MTNGCISSGYVWFIFDFSTYGQRQGGTDKPTYRSSAHDMLKKQVKFCIQKYIMHKTNRIWKLKIIPDKLSYPKFVNEMSVLEKFKTLARKAKVKV